MKGYSLSHLPDHVVLRELGILVARDRVTTAELLAHLAEVDARKLYLPAAYPSMYAYCVGELRLSEDTAFKYIRAARAARRFPAIYAAVSEGRLNVSAVMLLAPCLVSGSAGDLLAAAMGKSRSELELLLAHRFPQPDVPTQVLAVAPPVIAVPAKAAVMASSCQLAPGPVVSPGPKSPDEPAAPASLPVPPPRPRITPLAPERFAIQVTVGQRTHDKLRRAQELLAHAIPSGDVAEVLDRALDALIHELERRKLALTEKPRPRRSAAAGRYIPAEVRREVARRDGNQCTFVSARGRRCTERRFLEYDHVDPMARGGRSTVAGLRQRCRAHNQYAAECAFGKGFMEQKREASQLEAGMARRTASARAAARAHDAGP